MIRASLAEFVPEHPFISGHKFRNVVFEATALAFLMTSGQSTFVELALDYLKANKSNYHLVYLLHRVAPTHELPITCLGALIGAALEFQATNATIELLVEGLDGAPAPNAPREYTVATEIEIIIDANRERAKAFAFTSRVSTGTPIHLGSKLANTFASLPGEVVLSGAQELELTAPVEIDAGQISLRAQSLALRPQPQTGSARATRERHVRLSADGIESTLEGITVNGVDLTIAVTDRSGLGYPIIQHVTQRQSPPQDPALREKYLRLRKILVHFRSHSKGALAKYKHKIENERVAGNQLGQAILSRLLADEVLTLQDPLYFLNPDNLDRHLGINWTALQQGLVSDRLVEYLRSIQ